MDSTAVQCGGLVGSLGRNCVLNEILGAGPAPHRLQPLMALYGTEPTVHCKSGEGGHWSLLQPTPTPVIIPQELGPPKASQDV